MELRDRVEELALAVAEGASPAAVDAAAGDGAREQTLSALVNLGYPKAHAERVVEAAAAEVGASATLETWVRASLKRLG
jgi:Holliday junction DNA helicase RuvA